MDKGPVKQLLTQEFLRAHNVIFSPKNEKEAEAISQALIKSGFEWAHGKRPDNVRLVADGIVSKMDDMKIYRLPSRNYDYHTATATDFPHLAGGEFLTTEEFIDRKFNALAARVQLLEEKLDRVLALLEPAEAARKGLKP